MTGVLRPSSPDRMKKEPRTLGEFLKRRTKQQGLSITALAEAAKLHPSTVERAFEDGRSRGSTIFKIFRSLNLPLEQATQILSKFRPQNRFWFIRQE